ALRVKTAPLRVGWERRYAVLLGSRARDVLAYEESQRFAAFERRDRDFEAALVAFRVAARGGAAPPGTDLAALAADAATRAAALGLCQELPEGSVPYARVILAELARHPEGATSVGADVEAAIATGYRARQIRFL